MKKIILILIFAITMFSFTSCLDTVSDPIDLANVLMDQDYHVTLNVEQEDIGAIANTLNVKANGIACILIAKPNDYNALRSGIFLFCKNANIAKDMKENLQTYLGKEGCGVIFIRATAQVSGKTVFVGCKDVWEDIE